MKYNLAVKAEKSEAFRYFMKLANTKKIVEVKQISPTRTINQNSYLHLIIAAFAEHFGYSLSEAKLIYKEVNASIYQYQKRGRYFYRSSADLTREEMAWTIDNFMEKSKAAGCTLPPATDQEWLRQVENDIEHSRRYL